jgi:D-alanyl-D-alanine carboxypeptidase (penicillin-binding protein 5/6)
VCTLSARESLFVFAGSFKCGNIAVGNDMMKRYIYLSFLLFNFFCLMAAYCFADDIRSRSVVVMDASTGHILYAKNPYLRRLPASTTKLITSIIAVENVSPSELVTISRRASTVSPHKAGFREGDQVTVRQLLYAALLNSANDAAVALSEIVAGSEKDFVPLMNAKARSIGAEDTRFINSNGLPGRGQYTTAYDLAKIMRYVLGHQDLKKIIATREKDITTEGGDSISLTNTNKLLWNDDDMLGGKTGYTRRAMHCLVCAAERQNHTLIVAVLGSPSRSNLWRESETLIGKGFDLLENNLEPVIYTTGAASHLYGAGKVKTKSLARKKKPRSRMLARKKGSTYVKHKYNRKRDLTTAGIYSRRSGLN